MITKLQIEKSELSYVTNTCDMAVKKYLNDNVLYENKFIKFEHSIWTVLDPINNAIFSKQTELLLELMK